MVTETKFLLEIIRCNSTNITEHFVFSRYGAGHIQMNDRMPAVKELVIKNEVEYRHSHTCAHCVCMYAHMWLMNVWIYNMKHRKHEE